MMGLFVAILGWVIKILPAIPGLVHSAEALFRGQHKSGASKWIYIEQALSSEMQNVAQAVAALAPGTDAAKISTAVAVFTKSVNDAYVGLCNDLQIFSHST